MRHEAKAAMLHKSGPSQTWSREEKMASKKLQYWRALYAEPGLGQN
jgi:hypothetical protein